MGWPSVRALPSRHTFGSPIPPGYGRKALLDGPNLHDERTSRPLRDGGVVPGSARQASPRPVTEVTRRLGQPSCPDLACGHPGRPWFGADGICRYHGAVKGLKTLFRALSVRQARHMTDAVLPAALIGDGLAVHHVGRREREYLSFDAAGSTSALPQDEEEMITTVVHADQIDCRGRPWGGS